MKKTNLLSSTVLFILLLSGCGSAEGVYKPSLPKEYLEIECYDWQSEDVEEDNCLAFTYANREYLYYSNVEGTISEDDINECVGCTVYKNEINDNEMILTLSYDDTNDYLLVYYADQDLMGTPQEVYRSSDTRGTNIEKPDFVGDPIEGNPMYQYWKNY